MTTASKIADNPHSPVNAAQASRPSLAESAHGPFNVTPQLSEDQKLDKQVRNWVGQTFFGTLLKQMRDSPFKSEIFSGGRGGEAFQEMYDGRLAQHMANSVGTKIVRPIVKELQKKSAARAYSKVKSLMKEGSHVGADRRA